MCASVCKKSFVLQDSHLMPTTNPRTDTSPEHPFFEGETKSLYFRAVKSPLLASSAVGGISVSAKHGLFLGGGKNGEGERESFRFSPFFSGNDLTWPAILEKGGKKN